MRCFIYLIFIIGLAACNSIPSNLFKLEGFVEDAEDSEAIILYYYTLINNEWLEVVDTTEIINGKFLFEGKIDELTAAELVFDGSNIVFSARIYLEPTTMKLRINKSQPYAYEITGTSVDMEIVELKKALDREEKTVHQYMEALNDIIEQLILHAHNMHVQDSLINIRSQIRTDLAIAFQNMYHTQLDFISKHNTYQIIPDLLYLHSRTDDTITINHIEHIFHNLPERSKTGLLGKLAWQQIDYQKSKNADTSIGNIAPDFTRKDFTGKTVKLSDFKNENFVLLDFWANWCAPCVKEIPKLKDLYNTYNEKGLMIISISLDGDRNNWLEGINKYELGAWPQVLNKESNFLLNKDDIFFVEYNVETGSIPHFILIDKQGIILAHWKELGEEQLFEIDKLLQ